MNYNIDGNQLANDKNEISIDSSSPKLNTRALFCDGTEEYRRPCEPLKDELVTIRFRTAKDNVDRVSMITDGITIPMQKKSSDVQFDYYIGAIQLKSSKVDYYFQITCGQESCYYTKIGVINDNVKLYHFTIMPGYKTPSWSKGAVYYQIYVDRFFNGNISNDVVDGEYFYIDGGTEKVKDWDEYPAKVREFYGGDLKGVMKKLDYLSDLGIEVIYLNPIFVSPSNHKYDTQDYDYIDPHFGVIVNEAGSPLEEGDNKNEHASLYISRVTSKENLEASNDLFIQFVNKAHSLGIKVILDGVFNHCGSFNKWLDRERIYENQQGYEKGAYIDENSPYRSFFKFREEQWPYNEKYDGWWGHDTLPKLNYEDSPMLTNYIMDIAKKWVSPPYNIDGWRLDVAADLGQSNEFNHRFWKAFRKTVKEANPEAIIIAEHYGDPSSWLLGEEWDTVMNYDAFMDPLSWFLTGMEKHSDEFRGDLLGNTDVFINSMKHHMAHFNTQSLYATMNELSNHDHSRFLTRTNHKVGRLANVGPKAAEENINKGILREAVIFQMTWPGAPAIYYGDEAGVCGWTDPDNRRTYPWGAEDKELLQFHKELISIHKSYDALKSGSIKFLGNQPGVIAFGRFKDQEKFIVALNNNRDEVTLTIDAWEIGITDEERMVQLLLSNESGYLLNAVIFPVNDGKVTLTLPPVSGIIIKNLNR